LPDDRLDAIIILVAHRDTAGVEIENSEKTAHDFRASLNIIIGFTELMLDEVPGKINEEQRRSLNDILDNSQRLLALADDIVKRLETKSENKK
jgi:signal transduction histidine kinase